MMASGPGQFINLGLSNLNLGRIFQKASKPLRILGSPFLVLLFYHILDHFDKVRKTFFLSRGGIEGMSSDQRRRE